MAHFHSLLKQETLYFQVDMKQKYLTQINAMITRLENPDTSASPHHALERCN